MAASVTFDVVDDHLIADLRRIDDRLEDFIRLAAYDLAEQLREEGGQHSSRLAEPWDISGTGPFERTVTAPDFFAHFLTGGTKAHGPRSSDRMLFEVDGDFVAAMYVSGIPATHFDETAIARTRARVDDIIRRLIEGAT